MRVIPGQCHCGNLQYRFDWPGEDPRIPVRACGCTYCRKHGAVWTSHPAGQLVLEVTDADQVHHYRFGHHTAVFHICATCGILVAASCDMDQATYSVVNVNTFENVEPSEFDRQSTDFEAENETDRMDRRRRNWTPTTIKPWARP